VTLKTPSARGWIGAIAAAAVVIVVPILAHVPHHHVWEVVPGFYAWFGGLGCAAIVLVSKMLGKRMLQKPEDFYD